MNSEKQFNINIEKFADFSMTFALTDSEGEAIDLTGASITAAARENPESPDSIDFTAAWADESGEVTLSMPNELTASIGWTYGYYDVFATFANGTVWRILWGRVTVIPAVTRTDDGTPMTVLAYTSFNAFPPVGKTNRLYLDRSEYQLYFWTGAVYCAVYQGGKVSANTNEDDV